MTIDVQLKFDVIIEHRISQSTNIDLDSLFLVVHDVLELATALAHNHLKGEHQDLPQQSIPPINFNSPMHILKKILCKVGCTDENDGNSGNKVEASVLDDLLPKSKYSVGTRLLLTLAAFALQYGEFWFYFGTWNEFSTAMGALRRVENLKGHALIGECQKELIQLNDFVKETLKFIDLIIKVDKIFTPGYDTRDITYIEDTRFHLQNCSKIAIQTFVDCMVHFAALTNHWTVELDFSLSTSELQNQYDQLKGRDEICRKLIEEKKTYSHLVSIFERPPGITEVISSFAYSNSGGQYMLFDCSSNGMVTVEDVVKETKILLFISSLEINTQDISFLNGIYEKWKGEYKIIWIPAVEEVWESGKKESFEDLRKKMEWYTVVPDTPLKHIISYSKKVWLFKDQPLVVAIEETGSVNYRIEFHEIKTLGILPLPSRDQGFPSIELLPQEILQVEEGDYTFIYGGTDQKWIEEFGNYVNAIGTMNANVVSIKGLPLVNGKDELDRFWTRVGISLRHSWKNNLSSYNKEILKLLSLKNETTWALLLKGTTTVTVCGRGNTIQKILENFERNPDLSEKKFEDWIRGQHLIYTGEHLSLPCVRLEADSFFWPLHQQMECHCGHTMETVTIKRCCHGKQMKTT